MIRDLEAVGDKMIEPNNKKFLSYKAIKKKGNDYYDLVPYFDYKKYRKYINFIAPNIYLKLKDKGWAIKYNIFNVDGLIDDDKYSEMKKYDKIMCLTITKGDQKIFTEVKKSVKDDDDKVFMYNLALYRVWHELKKQKSPNKSFIGTPNTNCVFTFKYYEMW